MTPASNGPGMEGYALMPRHAPCVPCLSSLLLIAAFAVTLRVAPGNVRILRPLVIGGVLAEWCFELFRFHVL